MKKLLALLLAVVLSTMVFTACSGGSKGSSGGTGEYGEINFDEEPFTIHVCYPVMGEAQPDLALIQEKVNEVTLKEINAKVEFEAISMYSLANKYTLKASSQEKMDLIMLIPGYTLIPRYAGNNMIQPVGDLIEEWGPAIKEMLGDTIAAGNFNGQLYGIAQNDVINKSGIGFNVSVDLCTKFGIDPYSIKTLDQLEAAFEIAHKADPNLIIVAPEVKSSPISFSLMGYVDALGEGSGVLKAESDGSLKVVNRLEQDYYSTAVKKVREWFEKGYISKDVNTTQEDGSKLIGTKVFATAVNSITPAMGYVDKVEGRTSRAVLLYDPPVRSLGDDQLFMWAVPTISQRPEKSIQLLNLLDSNAYLTNLLQYGIEGRTYKLNEKGLVDNPDGGDNSGWQNYWAIFGNSALKYTYNDRVECAGVSTEAEYKSLLKDWNAKVTLSPAYGFVFDAASVRTEMSSCSAINDEYSMAVNNGTVNPDTELPKYIQRMKSAGMDKVIAEKQRQLDEWVKSKS